MKKISVTVYISEQQNNLLTRISGKTRRPKSSFVRESLDILFEKYGYAVDQNDRAEFLFLTGNAK